MVIVLERKDKSREAQGWKGKSRIGDNLLATAS
jgi:hypothetical protein